MTNREWLATLSDGDFVKWCLNNASTMYDGESKASTYIQPYPTLPTLRTKWNLSKVGIMEWLKEERNEKTD